MLLGNFEIWTMSPLWTGVFSITSVIVLGLLVVLGKRARRKEKSENPNSVENKAPPVSVLTSIPELNESIEFTGFAYEERQDIFYSLMNSWQRDFGYCRFYDEAAAAFSMIIDAEPIYFDYDGKHWLIEFWKGQYGMTTGGEVGIYSAQDNESELIDWNGRLYQCASDDEMLYMSLSLYKNKRKLFSRSGVHWWLTGFVLGEFSEPEELSMVIQINFNKISMRNAFIQGLQKAGYGPHDYRVNRQMVVINFNTPHSPQAIVRTKLTDKMVQDMNRGYCQMYQDITAPFTSITDKMNALHQENEELYNRAIHFGKQKELFQSRNKIKREKGKPRVDSQKTQ